MASQAKTTGGTAPSRPSQRSLARGPAGDSPDADAGADRSDGDAKADKRHGDAKADKRHADGAADKRHADGAADKRHADGVADKRHADGAADKRHADGAADKRHSDGAADKRHADSAADKRHADGAADKRHADSAADKRHAGADKREAIMAAALSLFVERGFYGTAVPEIADRAGVGAGTIYRYFPSKEALVNALYRTEKMRFAENVVQRVNAGGAGREPARELFKRLWLHMAEHAVDHSESFVFLELHHHAAYLDEESRALEQRMLHLFSGVIVAAQLRSEIKAGDPKLLMGIVMGAFIGVIRGCMEWNTRLENADWLFAERCVWEAIRA